MNSNNCIIYVLDTSSILSGKTINISENTFVTTPGVSDEISPGGKDYQKFQMLKEIGLKIISPSLSSIEKIKSISKETGDIGRLSKTDIEVLAVGLEFKNKGKNATILSDDYSIQNVAAKININYQNISQNGISKEYKWIYKCIGCGKKFKEHINICPICGSKTKVCISKKFNIKRKK